MEYAGGRCVLLRFRIRNQSISPDSRSAHVLNLVPSPSDHAGDQYTINRGPGEDLLMSLRSHLERRPT